MQLTRAADYAVRVMIHLASQPEGTVVSKTILAKASEAPESFLSKILQAMARAGLIQARRGVVGGFLLLERGAEASLLDVVESIDGPVSLNACLSSQAACHRYGDCAAHQVWIRAQEAMLAVLREAKIAEMASNGQSCCKLLNLGEPAEFSEHEFKQSSRRGTRPPTTTRTARPSSPNSGTARVTSSKNKIN